MRSGNIQQHNLIRPRRRMTMRQLRRITRIHDVHKLNTLHHTPIPNI
jgi:hypothetical protein